MYNVAGCYGRLMIVKLLCKSHVCVADRYLDALVGVVYAAAPLHISSTVQ